MARHVLASDKSEFPSPDIRATEKALSQPGNWPRPFMLSPGRDHLCYAHVLRHDSSQAVGWLSPATFTENPEGTAC